MEEASKGTIVISVLVATLVLVWTWKVVNWLWLRPKKLEKLLRQQGLKGTPYTLFSGDSTKLVNMRIQATSKPMNLSHDIIPYAASFVHHIVNKYGKNPFMWIGPKPRIIITDPVLIKDVMNKVYDFPKPDMNPLFKLLVTGLVNYEGEKWAKHRRMINPAFNVEKLKDIIIKRVKAMKAGEAPKDDLLGILLESNHNEIQEYGKKDNGMTIQDVTEECKLLYFAGQETTSVLLVWTIILLSSTLIAKKEQGRKSPKYLATKIQTLMT